MVTGKAGLGSGVGSGSLCIQDSRVCTYTRVRVRVRVRPYTSSALLDGLSHSLTTPRAGLAVCREELVAE